MEKFLASHEDRVIQSPGGIVAGGGNPNAPKVMGPFGILSRAALARLADPVELEWCRKGVTSHKHPRSDCCSGHKGSAPYNNDHLLTYCLWPSKHADSAYYKTEPSFGNGTNATIEPENAIVNLYGPVDMKYRFLFDISRERSLMLGKVACNVKLGLDRIVAAHHASPGDMKRLASINPRCNEENKRKEGK